jgi:hypothetical protein
VSTAPAADGGAVRVVAHVAGPDALQEGHLAGRPSVREAEHRAVEGAGGAQQALELGALGAGNALRWISPPALPVAVTVTLVEQSATNPRFKATRPAAPPLTAVTVPVA